MGYSGLGVMIVIYTEQTKKALKLCFKAHKDQVDKCGMPYWQEKYRRAKEVLLSE